MPFASPPPSATLRCGGGNRFGRQWRRPWRPWRPRCCWPATAVGAPGAPRRHRRPAQWRRIAPRAWPGPGSARKARAGQDPGPRGAVRRPFALPGPGLCPSVSLKGRSESAEYGPKVDAALPLPVRRLDVTAVFSLLPPFSAALRWPRAWPGLRVFRVLSAIMIMILQISFRLLSESLPVPVRFRSASNDESYGRRLQVPPSDSELLFLHFDTLGRPGPAVMTNQKI